MNPKTTTKTLLTITTITLIILISIKINTPNNNTIYPHIKLFNNIIEPENTNLLNNYNLKWKATHNDVIFTRSDNEKLLKTTNPHITRIIYRNMLTLTQSEQNYNIPEYCKEHSCQPENFYLHYKQDTNVNYMFGGNQLIRGWNPNKTTTITATATNKSESRIPDVWKKGWVLANIQNPSWKNYNYEFIYNFLKGKKITNGYLIDNADFYPPQYQISHSIEYWQIPENKNHPLINTYFKEQKKLHEHLETTLQKKILAISNARSPFWYYYDWFINGYHEYTNNILFEDWLSFVNTNTNQENPMYERNQIIYNEKIFEDSLNGKKFFLTARDHYVHPTNRTKMFYLSTFYLINNPNLYFMYYDFSQPWFDNNGNLISHFNNYEDFSWIPAVKYNIGKPIKNTLGKPDYKGNHNTNYMFEYENGIDPAYPHNTYHIIGREYERALVLVKWRPINSYVNELTSTVVKLNNTYQVLNVNGTLGTKTNQIKLKNNEGVILVKT